MRAAHPASARRGAGALAALSLVLLALIAVMGLARRTHASHVTTAEQHAVAGAMAELAAASALDEAVHALGRQANRPGDPLFERLRNQRDGATVSVAVPHTARALAADPLTKSLALPATGVRVELPALSPVDGAGFDRRGMLRLTATVEHPSTRTVRRITRDVDLRTSLLTAPRPFDQFTWLALDARNLVDPEANARIDGTLRDMKWLREDAAPGLAAQVRDLLTRVNERLTAVAPQVGASAEPIDVERKIEPFAQARFPVPPEFAADVTRPYHYLPSRLALFSTGANVPDLAAAWLRPRADRAAQAVETARTAVEQALAAHRRRTTEMEAASRTARDAAAVGRLQKMFEAWLAGIDEVGGAMAAFSGAQVAQIELYRSYTAAWGELAEVALRRIEALAGPLDADAARARAQHRFAGPNAARDAVAFLKRHTGAGRPRLNATLHVENADPLDLSALGGAVQGRLVLHATGAVRLRDVTLADPATDRLVIVAGGRLTAAGRVQAALIARGSFEGGADLKLDGLLVQLRVDDPALLRGAVQNEGRPYFSGTTGSFVAEHTHVAIAPFATRNKVERK